MTATKPDFITAHDRASELAMIPVVVGPLLAIAIGAGVSSMTAAAALGATCAVVAMTAFAGLASYGQKLINAVDDRQIEPAKMTRGAFAAVAGTAIGLTLGGAGLGMFARGVTHYVCQSLG